MLGENTFDYYFGLSLRMKENKILFIGGLTGMCHGEHDDIITTCMILTLNSLYG